MGNESEEKVKRDGVVSGGPPGLASFCAHELPYYLATSEHRSSSLNELLFDGTAVERSWEKQEKEKSDAQEGDEREEPTAQTPSRSLLSISGAGITPSNSGGFAHDGQSLLRPFGRPSIHLCKPKRAEWRVFEAKA